MLCPADGRTTLHALGELQARGTLFVGTHEDTYGGQIIGESSREADMEVRPTDLSFVCIPTRPGQLAQCPLAAQGTRGSLAVSYRWMFQGTASEWAHPNIAAHQSTVCWARNAVSSSVLTIDARGLCVRSFSWEPVCAKYPRPHTMHLPDLLQPDLHLETR